MAESETVSMPEFERALSAIPTGYTEGEYAGRRWGTTVKRSADLKRISLFAEDLSGTDIVSFNFYRLSEGDSLKPCEMSSEKVMAFVTGYRLEHPNGISSGTAVESK
ncbi:hypothetical protein [Rhizobium populisoli]|uniref:hypothetical protein n=1 Tax=Rhizobium populisoli TaxID=2859785 RepID=UPI0035E4448D